MSFGPPLAIKPTRTNIGPPSLATAAKRFFGTMMQISKIGIAAIDAARLTG